MWKNKLGLAHRSMYDYIFKKYLHMRYGQGCDIMSREWDNLILLDAARYDYFEEYISLPGNLTRIVSKGVYSWEFMEKNFIGNEFHDTVYITANPFSERLDKDIFHAIETVLDKWDGDVGTVHPEDVTRTAIKCAKKYPNKRLIIHYMQPHIPYLGTKGKEYRRKYNILGFSGPKGEKNNSGMKIWNHYRRGNISKTELEESYIQNLKIVETSVDDLVNNLKGKTVISSDHGENLGEKKFGATFLGHGNQSKEVRFVPWLELPFNQRKKVSKEKPLESDYQDDLDVQSKLEALGYT